MGYYFDEELFMLIPGLLTGIPSGLFGIATYILSALAIYTMARRRCLRKPWLAWVPVFNVWLLGSLSDQYQYVVKREEKSKRKWLLGLSFVIAALWCVVTVLGIVTAGGFMMGHRANAWVGPAIGLLGVLLPLGAATITRLVIRYMALYDVFKSLDPQNAVLYLCLSVLFRPTEAFFLFFNRDKDGGMPPRKQEPVYTRPEPQWQPEEPQFWENEV